MTRRVNRQQEKAIQQLAASVRAARLPSPAKRKAIRNKAGVSLRRCAEALDVHTMTVLHWERGDTTPSRSDAARYRELLQMLEEAVK